MPSQDPYAQQPGHLQKERRSSEEFNPYSTHQSYDQGAGPSYDNYEGYRDDPRYDYDNNIGARASGSNDNDAPGGYIPRKRTPQTLRGYRYNHHGGLWTKAGRGRCIGRFCCCTLMISGLLFICILLALALWIRPPNIVIGGVNTVQENGSTVKLVENGISVNLGVNISVNNPNYFAVNFKQIEAQIFYPINDTEIGSGIARDVLFHAHSRTNWTFPFAINYTTTLDPNRQILLDLAQKCGVLGGKSNLSVTYRIKLALRILFVTVSFVVKNPLNFECPLDASDLETLIKNIGLNIGGLLGNA